MLEGKVSRSSLFDPQLWNRHSVFGTSGACAHALVDGQPLADHCPALVHVPIERTAILIEILVEGTAANAVVVSQYKFDPLNAILDIIEVA